MSPVFHVFYHRSHIHTYSYTHTHITAKVSKSPGVRFCVSFHPSSGWHPSWQYMSCQPKVHTPRDPVFHQSPWESLVEMPSDRNRNRNWELKPKKKTFQLNRSKQRVLKIEHPKKKVDKQWLTDFFPALFHANHRNPQLTAPELKVMQKIWSSGRPPLFLIANNGGPRGTSNVFAWWNKFSFYFNFNLLETLPLTPTISFREGNKKITQFTYGVDAFLAHFFILMIFF